MRSFLAKRFRACIDYFLSPTLICTQFPSAGPVPGRNFDFVRLILASTDIRSNHICTSYHWHSSFRLERPDTFCWTTSCVRVNLANSASVRTMEVGYGQHVEF